MALTDAQIRAMGFDLPEGTDLIRNGDDNISKNARAAANLAMDALRPRPNLAAGRDIDTVRAVADAGAHRMPVTFTYGGTWPAGGRSDQQETLLVLPAGTDGQTCTQLILRYNQTWVRHAPGSTWGSWRTLSTEPVTLPRSTTRNDLDELAPGRYRIEWADDATDLGLPYNIGILDVIPITNTRIMQVYTTYEGELQRGTFEYQLWVRGQDDMEPRSFLPWVRVDGRDNTPIPHVPVASSGVSHWTSRYRYYDKTGETLDRPASTLKLLTLYTALQTVNTTAQFDTLVTVTAADISNNPGGSGGITFQQGDQISYRDLMYAMMLPSSNWAAEILARAVGEQLSGTGTGREKFLQAMHDIGTGFGWTGHVINNPSGLGDTNRLSAAMLVQLMLAGPGSSATHRQFAAALERTITFQGPNARTQTVRHTVDPAGAVQFPEFAAAKSGTLAAGDHRCLVMLWSKPGGGYAASALLGSDTDNRFKDMRAIINATLDGTIAQSTTVARYAYLAPLTATTNLETLQPGNYRVPNNSTAEALGLPSGFSGNLEVRMNSIIGGITQTYTPWMPSGANPHQIWMRSGRTSTGVFSQWDLIGGGVTHSDVATIRVTTNPAEVGGPGELVIVVEA